MQQRDNSLDLIKGIGCLLMIFAHAYVSSDIPMLMTLVGIMMMIGGLAPVFFFSVSGVTSLFSAKKYPFSYFLLFYAALFFFGFSYNGLVGHSLVIDPVFDIPQIIAMSVIVMVAIEKFSKRPFVGQGITVVMVLAILYLFRPYLPDFPLRKFLVIPGVFPLVPWLIFPCLGVMAYRMERKPLASATLLIAAASFLVLIYSFYAFSFAQFGAFWTDKWGMSCGYLLLTVTLLAATYLLYKIRPNFLNNRFLIYIGNNSLEFLYTHILVIKIFTTNHVYSPLIVWPAVIILTLIAMSICRKLNERIAGLFTGKAIWVVMLAVILGSPFVLHGELPLLAVNALMGMLFAYNYRTLASLAKEMTMRKGDGNKVTPASGQPA